MNTQSPVNLNEFNRILRTTLLLPVALLAVLAGLLVWQIQETLEIQADVDHSDRIISQLNTLQRLAVDQETGMRGYQLSGLPATLEPYHSASAAIPGTFTGLHALSATDAEDAPRVSALEQTLNQWQSLAAATIQAKHSGSPDADDVTAQEKGLMDSVRTQIAAMVHDETMRRDGLSGRVHNRIGRFLSIILAIALSAGVVIGIFTSNRLQRVSSAYDSALQQLQNRNEELFRNEQLLLTTLESIGDAVVSCDPAGNILFMNAVAQTLTQWPLEDAAGKPVDQVLRLVNELTHHPIGALIEQVQRGAAVDVPSHGILIARDGSERAVDHIASPVHTSHGGNEGLVVVFRDVTERRRTEATLIANEKLAVAGRLAASIAHEIHNPLDSVANLHFLMAHEEDPDKRAEFLSLAQQELARTLQISRAMLSLYRESQVPVQVDLKELIGSVLLLLDRKLRDAGIQLEQNYTQPTEVDGFPGELRQVFTNLIANAAEAAGNQGRIRIQVKPATPQDGRAGTLVEISDSGPGIAPHVEKKLFQPFITTKGDRGTGLGLWVSLGIVQKHGGTVRFSNNTQGDLRGALVRVYLPEKALVSETPALSVSTGA